MKKVTSRVAHSVGLSLHCGDIYAARMRLGRVRCKPQLTLRRGPLWPLRQPSSARSTRLSVKRYSSSSRLGKTAIAAKFLGGMNGRMTFVGEQYGHSVWSNFPISDVPRPGLRLGNLSAVQRAAAMQMLQVVLSPEGYRKVIDIMGSDQALSERDTPFAAGVDA